MAGDQRNARLVVSHLGTEVVDVIGRKIRRVGNKKVHPSPQPVRKRIEQVAPPYRHVEIETSGVGAGDIDRAAGEIDQVDGGIREHGGKSQTETSRPRAQVYSNFWPVLCGDDREQLLGLWSGDEDPRVHADLDRPKRHKTLDVLERLSAAAACHKSPVPGGHRFRYCRSGERLEAGDAGSDLE